MAEAIRVYNWAGTDFRFMYADRDGISMGGSDSGYAFYVGKDLLRGASMPSRVFANEVPLSASEEFALESIECWGFSDEIRSAEPSGDAGEPSRVDKINAGAQQPSYKKVSCDASDALLYEAYS